MNSVGANLKTERERQGLDIAEIAEKLCITQRYMRAIEQDDLAGLPGIFFYKSFVKQYAALLGVDETLLLPAMDALTHTAAPLPLPGSDPRYLNGTSEPPPLRDLDPIVREGNQRYFRDGRIGLSVVALVGMVLITSGFYAWYDKAPRPSPPAVQQPVQAQAEQPAPAEKTDAAATNEVQNEAKNEVRTEVKNEVQTEVKTEAPPAAMNVSTSTGGDGVNHVVLNLSATEKTWLSITSDGKQIFSGVLQPSETKTLTGLDAAKMKVGNAGGLEVIWNGKPIGPIGPSGQVRVVVFTPDNFQILTPNQTL